MLNIILGLGIILVCLTYLVIGYTLLRTRKIKSSKTGMNIALEILDDNSSINLIEVKDSYFCKYDMKRNMVKLTPSVYNEKNKYSSIIATVLAEFAILKSDFIKVLSKFFRNIRVVSFSPLLAILVSVFCHTVTDAYFGVIILVVIAFFQYMLNTIYAEIIANVKTKDNDVKNALNVFSKATTVFFVATLVQIVRLVMIILEINL